MERWAALCAVAVTMSAPLARGGVFISQYYEGTSNNKWVELYNPGPDPINLASNKYRIGLWSNANRQDWKIGNPAPTNPNSQVALSGVLQPGQTFLIRHNSATLPAYATADLISSGICNFNGDDSLVLWQGDFWGGPYTIADSIGVTASVLGDTSISRKSGTIAGNSNTSNYSAADWNIFSNGAVDGAASNTPERLGFFAIPLPFVQFDRASDTITEPTGTVPVDILKSAPQGNVAGQIALSGTATAGVDYVISSTNFSLPGAATFATITLTVLAGMAEGETAILSLVNVTNGLVAPPSTFTLRRPFPALYVAENSPGPNPPYITWDTAATNIQDAIDAAVAGELVLVSNGVYETGGRLHESALTNRVVIDKAITVRSVNGPEVTAIRGAWDPVTTNGDAAIRGVWIAPGATLDGFTITGGATRASGFEVVKEQRGGGLWAVSDAALITNCVIAGNSAPLGGGAHQATFYNCAFLGNRAGVSGGGAVFSALHCCVLRGNVSAGSGGGVHGCTLASCLLVGNHADGNGGAADSATMDNCTIFGNTAGGDGGGAALGTTRSCIVVSNTDSGGFGDFESAAGTTYSCSPQLLFGEGNITSDPRFLDAVAGDYRLQANSPCIDASLDQPAFFNSTDLDGNTRIINGIADMGAYELVFEVDLKAFLQGPYDTNSHRMARQLNLSSNAPYAADAREAAAIPTNAVDWAHFELRTDTNSQPAYSRSTWWGEDGYLLNDDGTAQLTLEVGTGAYHVVVHHRNHLTAMTAAPVVFTNRQISYDFTTGAGQSYGGSNSVIELEPGVWGMIAGDADGDGAILPVDTNLWQTQEGM